MGLLANTGIVGDLVSVLGHASLSVMKSSTTYLGIELACRVAESFYQSYSGNLPRPDRSGLGRFVFKLIRPFSGVEENHYKFPTGLLVISTVAVGTLTFLANDFTTPPWCVPHPCPICPLFL